MTNATVSIEAADAESPQTDLVADALMRVASPPMTEEATEESVTTLGLPPTLEYLENVPDTFNGSAFELRLYGEGCTECKHLVPSAEEAQNDCHFSNGNQFCPAAWNRIVFVGERMRFLSRIQKAQKSGDTNRVLNLLSKLESQPLDMKQFILKEIGFLK